MTFVDGGAAVRCQLVGRQPCKCELWSARWIARLAQPRIACHRPMSGYRMSSLKRFNSKFLVATGRIAVAAVSVDRVRPQWRWMGLASGVQRLGNGPGADDSAILGWLRLASAGSDTAFVGVCRPSSCMKRRFIDHSSCSSITAHSVRALSEPWEGGTQL